MYDWIRPDTSLDLFNVDVSVVDVERLRELVKEIREEVSCCCSWHRYDRITELTKQIEEILDEQDDV